MRSRLALGLVMVAMLMLPARGLGPMAVAQDDSTPTTGDVDELVVDGQRYSHDQAVPFDPAQMQERTDDSGAVIYVKPGDDPLGAVYLPHAGGAERYLPEHLDAPDTACPSEATNVGTIEGNGATYIPSGLETDIPVDQLTQVGSTADGRTLYAPTADQPFEVLYASGADGGLVRYTLMQQNGVPVTFPDRLSFAGQVFQLTAGETPNAEGLQRAGCAARFPALVDGAEAGGPYSAVYVQIPNGYVVYRSIGPGVTATEPGIVPLETQAPPTAVPTEIPPTAVPTEIPTEIPTAIPTEAPPTAAPTEIPTEVPTAVPTETPVPTAVPTEILPTLAPTEVPPTAAPTETLVPTATVAPTTAPTQAPAQPTGTTAPAAAPTQAPPATTAPTEAPAATQTPTPRPTPTPKPLEPQALVPTLPPNAPPPAASTSTVTGCTGDPGTTGANGLPSRLPMSLQYGGTGYRYVETVPVSEIGDLTRIGCVGPFEAYRGADQDGSLFLTLANVAESAWRYERTSSFTVRTEVSDTPRSLTLQGTGDQPDVTYRASDPLVRSVYSSVTLILYVADAESTTPDRVLGYAVDRDVFGEYVPEGQGDPVSQDVQAQAEELGIHPRLTIGNSNQTYVLVALWRPFGTTTNGWLTLYGPEGEAAPDQLIGIDPRRLDLQIFNRAD